MDEKHCKRQSAQELKKQNRLFCQVSHSSHSNSNVNKRACISYNRKRKLLLYLTECTLFRIHYIGKSETQFKVRLRNHRKYVNRQNSPLLDWHFKQIGHNFKQQAKFTLIEQLDNIIVEFF